MPDFYIKSLWRYPVKSMAGEEVESITLTPQGLEGDRRWAVTDKATGETLSAIAHKMLLNFSARYLEGAEAEDGPPIEITFPDGTVTLSSEETVHERLSDALGRAVELTPAPSPTHYQYDGPVNVLTESSLRRLQTSLPTSILDPRRFRPNILVGDDSEQAELVEFSWVGHDLLLGEARLTEIHECERCLMTTMAQADLPRDGEIMKTMIRETGQNLSVYAAVAAGGTIRRGTPVTILHS